MGTASIESRSTPPVVMEPSPPAPTEATDWHVHGRGDETRWTPENGGTLEWRQTNPNAIALLAGGVVGSGAMIAGGKLGRRALANEVTKLAEQGLSKEAIAASHAPMKAMAKTAGIGLAVGIGAMLAGGWVADKFAGKETTQYAQDWNEYTSLASEKHPNLLSGVGFGAMISGMMVGGIGGGLIGGSIANHLSGRAVPIGMIGGAVGGALGGLFGGYKLGDAISG